MKLNCSIYPQFFAKFPNLEGLFDFLRLIVLCLGDTVILKREIVWKVARQIGSTFQMLDVNRGRTKARTL